MISYLCSTAPLKTLKKAVFSYLCSTTPLKTNENNVFSYLGSTTHLKSIRKHSVLYMFEHTRYDNTNKITARTFLFCFQKRSTCSDIPCTTTITARTFLFTCGIAKLVRTYYVRQHRRRKAPYADLVYIYIYMR